MWLLVGIALVWLAVFMLLTMLVFPNGFPSSNREREEARYAGADEMFHPGDHDA